MLRHLEKELGVSPDKTRVVLQGFGNASFHCARLLHDDGFRIIGLSDSKSAIYDPNGMDPYAVMEHKTANRTISGAPTNGKAEEISNEQLLEKECELLIPAALEHQITEENAERIAAPLILELANGPTTPAADAILEANDTIVIPDILANAGGVTVSYFEWAQNKAGYYWSEDDVRSRLREFLEPQATLIWQSKQKNGFAMRTAAYVLALERIAGAVAAHGTKAYFQS